MKGTTRSLGLILCAFSASKATHIFAAAFLRNARISRCPGALAAPGPVFREIIGLLLRAALRRCRGDRLRR
jgi:hypothetical protein